MNIIKLKIAAKNLHTNKYWGYAYGVKFEDGGIQISFKKEQLEKIIQALESGELAYDKYGHVKFNLYEQEDRPKQINNDIDSDNIPF